jgi:tRNA dimethylallyltransferase
VRAKSIDPNNKRRLIRALEIILTTGKPVPLLHASSSMFNVLWLGVKRPQTDLYKKIDRRLKQRLEAGMIEEVKKLKKSGLSWKRLEDFGLEYRFVSQYLQKKLTFEEMFTQLSYAIKHYSKRQMTWWKRNKEINWIEPDAKTASRLVAKFLS